MEWTLESRAGKTIVCLAQSAFLGNEDWENEWFDSTSYGWGFMLLSRWRSNAIGEFHGKSPGRF